MVCQDLCKTDNNSLVNNTHSGLISNWKSFLSGVPQGSVFGPILILIYIHYLEDDISSKVLKFADDTKVFRKVTNDRHKQIKFTG